MDYRLEQLRFELREDPSSRSFFKLGEHLRREGQFEEAIEVLRSGLEEHDRYVAAWVSLGRAQLDNGDAKEAQISLERSLQLDPENAVASRAMGEAAIVNDDWLTAVKALKRARGLSPQDDTLDERIAFVEEHLGELGLLEKPAPVSHRIEAPVAVGQDGEDPGEEPFAVQSAGDTGIWDDANDVFAAGMVEDEEASETTDTDAEGDEPPPEPADDATEDSSAYAEPPPLTEDDVASMVDGDETLDTAELEIVADEEEVLETEAVETADGSFAAPEPEPVEEYESVPVPESDDDGDDDFEPEDDDQYEDEHEHEQEDEDEDEDESENEPDSDDDDYPVEHEHEHEHEHEDEDEDKDEHEDEDEDEHEQEDEHVHEDEFEDGGEQELATDSEPSPEDDLETPPESWPDPEPDAEPELEKDADGIPLPTMTLARLAIDQGDLDLAERTLRGVIEREPEHSEAAELLETLVAGPPEADSTDEIEDTSDPKVEALQRWLDAVRLASERLKT